MVNYILNNPYISMKNLIIHILLLGSAVFMPCLANAQDRERGSATSIMHDIDDKTIMGTVLDENGEPLPGATIRVEGTNQVAATDIEGNFSILAAKKNPTILITYVGMKPVTLHIDGKNGYLQIKMEPNPSLMDEVVVTGYQNIKRENATGSYQVITSKDLDKRSVQDLSSNLEGRVPGLVKNGKSSSSDEDAFTIRGRGSFQARTAPLVVVDGLPIEGGMSTINPYDIENVTVLKDAAAASIYGARASNGVIVVTTKQARSEKLSVDLNFDFTFSENQDYSNFEWASSAEMIELERYNFAAMLADPTQSYLKSVMSRYDGGRINGISKVMRLFIKNQKGELSDSDLEATLAKWGKNDYRKEWQDVYNRSQARQQYNIGVRSQGKVLNSNLVMNFAHDNMGIKKEHLNSLTLKYRGDIKAANWLDVAVGVNILNNRTRTHDFGTTSYADINSFMPYESMYADDGTLSGMEAEIYPGYDAFNNAALELKDCTFNLANEMNKNFRDNRYTNTRAFIHANFKLLPGWDASAQFQYEDIYGSSKTIWDADTYMMRKLYSAFTTGGHVGVWEEDPDFNIEDAFNDPDYDWTHFGQKYVEYDLPTEHHIPDNGLRRDTKSESQYYTFRTQTDYKQTFGRHAVEALAGFEYRQTHSDYQSNVFYGYDHQTQSNLNIMTDWAFLNNPSVGVFGDEVPLMGMPLLDFSTSDVMHRYYSIYFTGNYVYDTRYSIFGSYRVDKTDLFGTDPKFRGRPLWSVGLSWNAHNEPFLNNLEWISALKVRGSYGLTGNIDSSVSSYLIAKMKINSITGDKYGSLVSPPNDQLRWEKTATWNIGADFAFLNYRINGSIDYYHKKGTDILTVTDLDHTNGWESLTINSGSLTNNGIELQLDGRILQAISRDQLGISLGVNFSYNKNKVTKVSHYASSGAEYLQTSLKEGYPLNSLFSFDYAGFVEDDGQYYMGWRDHNGDVQTTPISNSKFAIEDAVYCGTATPKFSGAIIPEISWKGFSLSAMLNFYGGHMMRVGNNEWYTGGGEAGYTVAFGNGAVPKAALNYWKGDRSVPGNGVEYYDKYYGNMSYSGYRNDNIVHADYMKFRSLTLSYNFSNSICRKIRLHNLRLRFQVNNICTWSRNGLGIDPEAWSGGSATLRVPRSYTLGLYINI